MIRRILFVLLLAAPLAVAQDRKAGLTSDEKKEALQLAADHLTAKSWEEKTAISEKLAKFRPSKSDLAAVLARCWQIFRKGPLHDGKSPAKCSHPSYPGSYIITVPGGAKRGEKVGLFISLHGGGAGVGAGSQIQGLFGTPGQNLINIYPTVVEKTDAAWNTEREEQYVLAILDDLKRTYNIDTNRTFMAGHSMGGFGTWSIGGRHADLFAALSPQAGGIFVAQNKGQVTGLEGGVVTNLKNTPIWFYHSTDDPQVPSGPDEKAAAALAKLKEKYGPFDYVWKLYTDIGHGLPRDGVAPIFQWMLQKTRDPLPKHVLWEGSRAYKRHFYWLKREAGFGGQIEARRAGNKITLAGSLRGVSVLLNEKMVDFSKPVILEVDGKEVFNAKVEPSLATLVETFDARHDGELIFTATVKVPD